MEPADGADDTVAATEPEIEAPTRRRDARASIGSYQVGALIGEGGMGEVLLAHDPTIDRDVAIKRMRTADPTTEALARFLREAKIQARLDHPAIVPVHELGHDADGRPYFTMKRITGTTMLDLMSTNAPTQRLLRAFAEVCLAIELAHSKRIIHRDLKPSNIMLGDYGEVYVLDWGIARVLSDTGIETSTSPQSVDGATEVGAILGTPGYMAPEQVRGEPVEGAADVYSLGCILFEILAREPVHPRGHAALASTLEGVAASPAQRRPDRTIAPELDAACTAALAQDPHARPSARALGERVQRYLDGDRDLERRRELAAAQLTVAEAALAKDDRATAMAAAGRALALDPESRAASLVTKLMLEPPRIHPPSLRRDLEAAEALAVRNHARTTMYSYLVIGAVAPLVVWNGVKSWPLVIAILLLGVALTLTALLIARRPQRSLREMVIYFFGNAALLSLIGRLCGPLIITPTLACMMIMSAISYPVFAGRSWFLFGVTILGWLLPVGLELAGMVPSTWQVVDGAVISTSNGVHLGGNSTIALVFGVSTAIIAVALLHAGTLARANRTAQGQLVTQAWHLRQLLPASQ